jgi:serine/threonine protein kinase
MPLSPGDKLGPYEIIARIGKGGMGEVWKARDPRVGRDVAIKVSAAQFSEPFEREAKAIGALNHPNIRTLRPCYGVSRPRAQRNSQRAGKLPGTCLE